jgi:hypothetical protein
MQAYLSPFTIMCMYTGIHYVRFLKLFNDAVNIGPIERQ